MKKLLLSFAGLALTGLLAPAQVALITRAGASLATVHAPAAGPDRQYAAGWVGGAGLNLPLDQVQVVSLQPEVLFNRKGFARLRIALGKVRTGNVAVALTDLLGRVYYQQEKAVSAGETAIILELAGQSLKPGVYLLRVKEGHAATRTVKLIKR